VVAHRSRCGPWHKTASLCCFCLTSSLSWLERPEWPKGLRNCGLSGACTNTFTSAWVGAATLREECPDQKRAHSNEDLVAESKSITSLLLADDKKVDQSQQEASATCHEEEPCD
jgi:hypothetical protein